MPIQAFASSQVDPSAAVRDLEHQAEGWGPQLVVYFASSHYDQPALAGAMHQAFEGAALVGCSTAGEIVSGRMLEHSVVAMSFGAGTIGDVAVEIVEDVTQPEGVTAALQRLAKHYGTSPASLGVTRLVGLILVDGLSRAEEQLMDRIGNLTDVTFVGGSAGDDLSFHETYVHANGRAYRHAAVLALIEPRAGFDIIKTQSFLPLGRQLVATAVDEATRTVLQFDHRPAVEAYAEALGVPPQRAGDFFMSNPLALMIGKEPYIRSPQRIQDGRMVFYCNIKQGTSLELMRSTDIVRDTRAALQAKTKALGPVAGIINFHCILRTLELAQRGQSQEYGQLFASVPTIGFSTYGEQYIGHINQTSTMLLFR